MSRLLAPMLAALYCWMPCASSAAAAAPQGLPALDVAALAAAPNRLYVGGFDDGLFILESDGRARRFQDPALSPHINALAWSEREQILWLGTARGLVRCRMERTTTCKRLGPSSAVHALLLRSDASVVAGGDAGLTFADGQATRVFGKKQGAPFRSVWALTESEDALFVGSTNGLFWGAPRAFVEGGAGLSRAALVSKNLPDDWVTALLRQGDRLLVGTYNAGVVGFQLRSGQLRSDAADSALGYVNPAGLFAVDVARVAVATMDGLRSGALGHTALVKTNARDITAVVPAAGGGYWIGTRQGLEWLESVD